MTIVASRALSIAAALGLCALAAPSFAQGTAAQREACAPDAIRLCQETIPDVPKTAACMRAHISELSPSCRHQFVASKEGTEGRSRRRTARAESQRAARTTAASDDALDFGAPALPDDAADTPASRAEDARNARRVVKSLCRNDILGADTCRLTLGAIDLARQLLSPTHDDDDVEVEAEPVRTAYSGFFKITVHELRHGLFDGRMGPSIRRELLERGRSVCVLPYDPKTDRVLLIRQFLIGSMIAGRPPRPLQVVAGIVDAGETEEGAARREAQEEAGCDLKRMVRAQSFLPSPGGSSERVVAFCGEADLDGAGGLFGVKTEGEDIRAEIVSSADAVALLDGGSIESGPAVVILSWFARHRERLRGSWL